MTRKVVWTHHARQFLLHGIQRPDKRAAILDAVGLLSDFPEAFPVARSRRFPGHRAITLVHPFVVLYRADATLVTVVAVFAGRRRSA